MDVVAFLISIAVAVVAWFYAAKKLASLNAVLRHLIGSVAGVFAMLTMVAVFVSLGLAGDSQSEVATTHAVEQAEQQEEAAAIIQEQETEAVSLPDIFTVTKDEYMATFKRTVEVSLDRKATEEELAVIAKHIHGHRKKDTERTFIGYHLNTQDGDDVYWATTHYNPELRVSILNLYQLGETAKEWYEGGTLHEANGLEWQQATYANKLATAGDLVAASFKAGKLVPELANSITGVDDIKLMAAAIVTELDIVFAPDDDPEMNIKIFKNQKVNVTTAMLMVATGWIK